MLKSVYNYKYHNIRNSSSMNKFRSNAYILKPGLKAHSRSQLFVAGVMALSPRSPSVSNETVC